MQGYLEVMPSGTPLASVAKPSREKLAEVAAPFVADLNMRGGRPPEARPRAPKGVVSVVRYQPAASETRSAA